MNRVKRPYIKKSRLILGGKKTQKKTYRLLSIQYLEKVEEEEEEVEEELEDTLKE